MENIVRLPDCTLIQGDCIEKIKSIQSATVGLSVFSPPFPEMYVYNNDERDMANCSNYNVFKTHFKFLLPDLFRVMQPGRNVAIHCMDIPIQKGKHGYIGLRDFSGMIISAMEDAGFIYHSRVTIWKNPATEMQRTKALGLLHKQLKKDSTKSRVGIPDYVLVFKKPGENESPVKTNIPVDTWREWASPVWQFDELDKEFEMIMPLLSEDAYRKLPEKLRVKYASPVWMDIDYGNTLNAAIAREERDEKHICPLQLDTIDRLISIYSNEWDLVFTPFGGIGSESYQALLRNRKTLSIELKNSYFNISVQNCKNAIGMKSQATLFDALKEEEVAM